MHHAAYRDVVTRQFGSWEEKIQDDFFNEGWNRAPHKIVLMDGVLAGIYSVAEHSDHIFLVNSKFCLSINEKVLVQKS